jgi:hypothetical protein
LVHANSMTWIIVNSGRRRSARMSGVEVAGNRRRETEVPLVRTTQHAGNPAANNIAQSIGCLVIFEDRCL